jgi:alpha-D-ribose 1-methylphosphonate 5-phosphate C-P lyase
MDYTNNPENNMQPAYANFKFLAELYGTVDGSPVPTDDNAAVESSSAVNGTGGGRDRRLLPAHIVEALRNVDVMADNGMVTAEQYGWRKLHDSVHAHAHVMDLGDGYTVQIHILKA